MDDGDPGGRHDRRRLDGGDCHRMGHQPRVLSLGRRRLDTRGRKSLRQGRQEVGRSLFCQDQIELKLDKAGELDCHQG